MINEIHIRIKKKCIVCFLVPLAAASEYLMPFITCPRESMSTSYINVSKYLTSILDILCLAKKKTYICHENQTTQNKKVCYELMTNGVCLMQFAID